MSIDDDLEKNSPRENDAKIEDADKREVISFSEMTATEIVLKGERGQNWAELRVKYEWSTNGDSFSVTTLRYTARASYYSNQFGRIFLKVMSPVADSGWLEIEGRAFQDGAPHNLASTASVRANANNATIYFSFYYSYPIADPDNLTDDKIARFLSPPSINSPVNSAIVRPDVRVEGYGEPGATVYVHKSLTAEVLSLPARVEANRWWKADLLTPLLPRDHSWTAQQHLDGMVSNWARDINFKVVFANPIIVTPESDTDVGNRPWFSGTGVIGAKVQIHQTGTGDEISHIDTYVIWPGVWSLYLLERLRLGEHHFTAKQTLAGVESNWAPDIRVNVIPRPSPEITDPVAGSVQNMSFTLSGTGGALGAQVHVFNDNAVEVGRSGVLAGTSWTCPVTVDPGRRSLVALLRLNGEDSDRSEPRAFDVRPATLTNVTVTDLSETAIRFSGSGYTGATVQITVVSGPTVEPPPEVPVEDDGWYTTATNWPFGSYSLKAIQKVSDHAGGWIESQPHTFPVNRVLPDVSEVTYTQDYQPTISGKGFTGASVRLANPGGGNDAAPNAPVSNSEWSSRVSQVWGPTYKREVHLKQSLDGQSSPNWYKLEITIPPLAPVMNVPVENGLSPDLSGTCWPGAVLKLKYSDSNTEHPVTNNNGSWSFRRETPFEPEITHTATLTQTDAEQTSPPASRTFTVSVPMLQPVITHPDPGEVGRDVTIRGREGMAGATMQLRDAQFKRPLGEPKMLTTDGEWFIELSGLEFRDYVVDAQQTLDGRQSEHSAQLDFTVVLLPPEFDVPQPGGKLPRTSQLSGRGMRNGRVSVWLQGRDEPLRENISVSFNGDWEAEVTLPVGETTIRARQFFVDEDGKEQSSAYSDWLAYNVVPAAPFIETPAMGERIGRRVVVSGFGVPGDTVTVRLGDTKLKILGRSPVLEDRTWSVTVTLDQPGGAHGLVAVAESEGFESEDSAPRAVVLGTYLPSIDVPASGHWVDNPVEFEGRGRPGVGQVVSWYNPDRALVADLGVDAGAWQGEAVMSLPSGGHWCRFKQTLTDSAGDGTVSDWIDSGRFDVLPPSSQP
ncbi:hypothetical protein [Pseudomonas sp. Z1-6]|uniref:hypothetical protein n=1 Tax=Pseudomonas sp. Z1-6 TaxID=2817407 RepID=UPI003DA8E618